MTNLQPLRHYLRQNISHLRSTPCLLITSSPPPAISTAVAGTKNPHSHSLNLNDEKQRKEQREQLKFQQQQTNPKIHAFVQRNVQSLTQEFNLRSVPITTGSAFPTLEGVNEAVSLAKRAGLKGGGGGSLGAGIGGGGEQGVVIGIGSGAAIDLAKAVADTLFGNNIDGNGGTGSSGSLVLAPSTLGGLWAASSNSPSLLLDTKEEMLLPHLTSSWGYDAAATADALSKRRRGTIVTLDSSRYLAMPPLYSAFRPMKRSEYSSGLPSMAHVAAAVLSIVLDVARSVDVEMKAGTTTTGDERSVELHRHVAEEMKAVASSCALVLQLATQDAKNDNSDGNDDSHGTDDPTSNHMLAQQHLLDAIPRLSPLVEQSSLLAQQMSMMTAGTIPHKMAHALMPAYFPQCHIVTYLASILPGLCDALAARDTSSSSNGKVLSMVESVTNSIINCGEDESDDDNANATESPMLLSSWASQVAMEAGIPSMASLAFGTPDLNALVGSLDSYETLVASLNGGGLKSGSGASGRDDHWIMEDVLQRSLNR